MEREDIPLVEIKELGSVKDVIERYPLTVDLNVYLDMKGAGPLPVLTGNTLEDMIHFMYAMRSNPLWGHFWHYIARYFDPNHRHCDYNVSTLAMIDYLNGDSNVLSDFMGDIIRRTHTSSGPYHMLSFIQLLEDDDKRIAKTVRESFVELDMSSAYIYLDRDRGVMESAAIEASKTPREFRLLINTNTNTGFGQGLIYMNVVTELVCLTLIKCFSLSLSLDGFQRRFGELYSVYLQTRHREWYRSTGSRRNIDYSHYISVLVSDVYQCYANGLTPEYYEDYRKAVMFACEALDVDLFEVLLKHPTWEKFLMGFFYV